ncbi:nuclear transport factor 2 family protein [Uliginosibacterium paludis]|uniref:Nuclear transport factor 2 family protein n=1 Tax=Uliginosibacterium paludis TaxID=1615952 RepID=A0ABV2CMG2_9RHOO
MLADLIDWYQTLSPGSVSRAAVFYAPDARFIDPFNDVRGVKAIEGIFLAMFEELDAPRFKVVECCRGEASAMLRWQMNFRRQDVAFEIQGVSCIGFDPNGQVCRHEDYWDPAKALFMGIPLLGWVLRKLYSRLSATVKSL